MWALAPIGMLAAFSCQDDMLAERQPEVRGDRIAFTVAGDSTWMAMSRSGKKMSRHFITMMGKDSVFLQVVEEKNTELPFNQPEKGSRSASFTTENLKSFSLAAYYNNEDEFMMDQEVTKTTVNKEVQWTYSPVKYWPNNPGDVISFYGHALYNDQGTFTSYAIDKEKQSLSFSYALPAAETDADKNDAVNQPDLIFAIAKDQTKPTVTDKVELVFHHALSAILFKIGNLSEEVMIKDISLKSVSTSGDCTYQEGKDGLEFVWENQNTDGNYTQAFNVKKTGTGNQLISTGEKLFMMIPQDLDEAVLKIKFKVGEKVHTLDCPLDMEGFPQAWNPDTKYTYIISTTGLIDVEVDDDCTPTIKSNVKIQNTGLSPAYIRATVVGYWVNEAGIIVRQWKPDEDGTFDWESEGGIWSEKWTKGADGFYYHKEIVQPSGYTFPLFDTYTLKEGAGPFAGAELILNIVAQAVDDDSKW